jgi:DNA-binding transcriptional LysR family regulator
MELRHLRYFCAVADRQSFTLAAKYLHVSQSGVSGQVRALEKELGVQLLHRNRRDVSLTTEGSVFLPEAREVLAHADRAIALTIRASRGQFGKLSIGLCGPATAPFLPGLIREFRKRNPGVTLSLKDIDPTAQPEALASGIIDIGFTRGIPPELRKTLRSRTFFREAIVAVLPEGHPLADQLSLQLAQIASDPLVLYSREESPDLFDMIVDSCKRAKFSPRIADTPSRWQSILTLVEAGEGVGLVPACVRHLHSRGVTFHALKDRRCGVDVILAWRRQQSGPIREAFLDLLWEKQPQVEQQMRAE